MGGYNAFPFCAAAVRLEPIVTGAARAHFDTKDGKCELVAVRFEVRGGDIRQF
jgi:hypothetical protein